MSQSPGAGRILSPGRNCLGVFDSPLCGVYVDADEYYRAFAEAARAAKQYIMIAGWQFDSEVRLIRESGLSDLPEATTLLAFLNYLCRANPDLQVYILAWDHSIVFALEREWFQSLVFRKKTLAQVHFRFDAVHSVGASHHQKFAVIDGLAAFAGGMDICAGRWDDRMHRPENLKRIDSRGRSFGPYHDIQACVSGHAAAMLARIFETRWVDSGGDRLELPREAPSSGPLLNPTLLIESDRVAISRTQGRTIVPVRDAIREIRQLYLDAIAAADSFVYIENQYFSSQAVYEALLNRMSDRRRPPIEIVMVLPQKLSGVIEGLSIGLAQAKMLASLKQSASQRGHSLGIYYPAVRGQAGTTPVYVHSKVMMVDDRFLTIGSANTTNRSMGLDTELNLSWEAGSGNGDALSRSMRKLRTDLLREHTGNNEEIYSKSAGLVRLLDGFAYSGQSGLLPLEARDYLKGNVWLKDIPPEELAIDPEAPVVEENIFEVIAHDKSGRLARLLMVVNRLLGKESVISPQKGKERKKGKNRRRAGRLTLLGKAAFIAAFLLLILSIAAIIALVRGGC